MENTSTLLGISTIWRAWGISHTHFSFRSSLRRKKMTEIVSCMSQYVNILVNSWSVSQLTTISKKSTFFESSAHTVINVICTPISKPLCAIWNEGSHASHSADNSLHKPRASCCIFLRVTILQKDFSGFCFSTYPLRDRQTCPQEILCAASSHTSWFQLESE